MSKSRSRLLGAVTLLAIASGGLAACDGDAAVPGAAPAAGDRSGSAAPEATPFRVRANVARGATDVPVDTGLEIRATEGTLSSVRATSDAGRLSGRISGDGSVWRAAGRLEPGTTYTVKATGEGSAGEPVTRTLRFATRDLTLDEQTYPSVAPLDGETVGVGMPVIVNFDLPVTDKASFERHMKVTTQPVQQGTWHWLSDTEAHWRPKSYWKPGTKVKVDVDVNSVSAGNGIYGQESRRLKFEVGDAHIYKVNTQTHQMKVFSNGELLRTIPITTGKPGFTTRSGVKVIMEKFETKRMNSETVGIGASNPEFYDIDDVRWAMRLTHSGEFIHGAPWSVGSQGYANVSHGCTGMSDENAKWLYDLSRRGDVVEYTGTDVQMTLENGYGDWNEPYREYAAGSALG